MSSPSSPIRPWTVWCLLRDQFAHVKPVEAHLGERAEFVYDDGWDPEELIRRRPDLVLCVNDYHYDVARCLAAARTAGIPSLVVQDGILEWRCQYENPLFGAGGGAPQHQPVLADKIACLGPQSARQIARWGNAAKVESTGMPRLDYLLERRAPPVRRPAARVLVMTAKTPGFTPAQVEVTLRSLREVKSHLEKLPAVEVVWRVSGVLAQKLDVANRFQTTASQELADLLEHVDAVITTPSTAMLEAMLLERPVAALDYHNVPRFVPTAWTISASEHIEPVMRELLDPPARKMAFQRDCLHDCLACDGPASPRVALLIERLIAHAQSHADRPCLPPAALLNGAAPHGPAVPPSLHELYPDEPVFQEKDPAALQAWLARLQAENRQLHERLRRTGMRGGVYRLGRYLVKRLHA